MAKFNARLGRGMVSQLQQRDPTAAHGRDYGTFVKEPQGPTAASSMAGTQTCRGRPQQQYSTKLVPSNGLQRYLSRKDPDKRI